MFTGGTITNGLNAQKSFPVAERLYLFNQGDNKINATGCWENDGYSLFNGKTINRGNNPHVLGYNLKITSPGNGQSACVLMGTQISIPANLKRYLVVEAKVSSQAAAADFSIILSKSKEITDDSATAYYSFSFKELFLKYYIDLSELSGFTRAYVSIAGGALANWTSGAELEIRRLYLTEERQQHIVPLYNRGPDFNSYVEGGDADFLVGWEGHSDSYDEAATLETGDILLQASASKGSYARTIRGVDLNKIGKLNVLVDVIEYPTSGNGSPFLYLCLLDETGTEIGFKRSVISATGTKQLMSAYMEMRNNNQLRSKNRIGVRVTQGVTAKLYGVWIEQ